MSHPIESFPTTPQVTADQCAVAHAPVVVIPAYNPSMLLVDLVSALKKGGRLAGIVVVNDGSKPECDEVFSVLRKIGGVAVLRHATNLGKGAALKTGMNYAACTFPGATGVVTADADGQHTVTDIQRVAGTLLANSASLVLGVRAFGKGTPARSKAGNTITRYVLWVVTGQKLRDTQTGLRGIPMEFARLLLRLPQNGYDFELETLLVSKRIMRTITEVGIATIYTDGNRGSHFNPLLDSMRIYFVLVRFAAVSVMTAALDNIVFIAAFHLWPNVLGCQVLGRGVAGLFNYYSNKTGVFHSGVQDRFALPRYWMSVAFLGALSYFLIWRLHAMAGFEIPAAKLCVETALFALSFLVQRDFVFLGRDPSTKPTVPIKDAGN